MSLKTYIQDERNASEQTREKKTDQHKKKRETNCIHKINSFIFTLDYAYL